MVIEAIASKDWLRRMYWAVQFHPEYAKDLAWANAIFSYVVQGCARDMGIDRGQFELFREDVLAWLWLRGRALHELQQQATGKSGPAGPSGPAGGERQTDALLREAPVVSSRV
jgi:hypothetical protein